MNYNPFNKISNEQSAIGSLKLTTIPIAVQAIGFLGIGLIAPAELHTPPHIFVTLGAFLIFAAVLVYQGNKLIVLPLAVINLLVTVMLIVGLALLGANAQNLAVTLLCTATSLYSIKAIYSWVWLKLSKTD